MGKQFKKTKMLTLCLTMTGLFQTSHASCWGKSPTKKPDFMPDCPGYIAPLSRYLIPQDMDYQVFKVLTQHRQDADASAEKPPRAEGLGIYHEFNSEGQVAIQFCNHEEHALGEIMARPWRIMNA